MEIHRSSTDPLKNEGAVLRFVRGSISHFARQLWLSLCAPVAHWLLGNRAAVFLGTISYSVYLLHYPVLRILSSIEWLQGNLVLFLPIFLGSVLVVAWLSFRFIEAPLRSAINGRRSAEQALQPV